MQRAGHGWAGIDAGKGHHHVHVIDEHGNRLLSQRVINDEAELTRLIDAVLNLAPGSPGRSIWRMASPPW